MQFIPLRTKPDEDPHDAVWVNVGNILYMTNIDDTLHIITTTGVRFVVNFNTLEEVLELINKPELDKTDIPPAFFQAWEGNDKDSE